MAEQHQLGLQKMANEARSYKAKWEETKSMLGRADNQTCRIGIHKIGTTPPLTPRSSECSDAPSDGKKQQALTNATYLQFLVCS